MDIDWAAVGGVMAGLGAVASAVAALLLWRVTTRYTTSTDAIRAANEAALVEMEKDREVAHATLQTAMDGLKVASENLDVARQEMQAARLGPSVAAAARLQDALVDVMELSGQFYALRETVTIAAPENILEPVLKRWASVYLRNEGQIQPVGLREDVGHFHAMLNLITGSRSSLILWASEREKIAPSGVEVPGISFRLHVLARRLGEQLDAHIRGEEVPRSVLPGQNLYYEFWVFSQSEHRATFEPMGLA